MGRQGTPRSDASRKLGAYTSAHRQKRRWLAALGVAAAAVVLCTVYALTMPASTLTWDQVDGTEAEAEAETTEEAAVQTASAAEGETSAEVATTLPDGASVPEGYTQTFTYEDTEKGYAVSAYAAEGVVPEGATLKASLLSEGEDAYAAAEEALAADADDESDYGFAALDIRFEDAEGNEVEPSGDVYVVINAEGLLPDDADPSTVTVQHLAEDESGSVASVDAVADAADATDGVVNVSDDTNVQAAFSVDSFSTFTITWESSNGQTDYFEVTVHYVDQDNQNIDGVDTDNKTFRSTSQTYTFSEMGDEESIDGYTYSHATFNGSVVTEMKFERGGRNGRYTYTLTFYNGNEQVGSTLTYNDSTVSVHVYLVYQESTTGLYISNTIQKDGMFNAEFGKEADVPSDAIVTYTWYRCLTNSEDEGDWDKVERERVTGTQDNLSTDGKSVNVALDAQVANASDAERYWYKVVATYTDADGNEQTIQSRAKQVPYYLALQNGSFETPTSTNWNNQLPNGTEGLIWLTTGTNNGQDIEIASVATTNYKNLVRNAYNIDYADEGDQFAELNCEAYGALYQDVMTVPGSTLNWWLSHAGRTGEDTMALVIMPVDKAEDLTAELEQLNAAGAGETAIRGALDSYKGQDGVYIEYFSDNNGSWSRYFSTQSGYEAYEVPEEQYLTRFFFVAVSTENKNPTTGNLLDRVGFSTKVPAPTKDQGQITVTKVVDGYTPESGYSVTVTIKDSDGSTVASHMFSANNFINNRASYTFVIDEMTAYSTVEYTVEESVSNAPSGYNESSTVQVGAGSAQPGTSGEVKVTAGEQPSSVTFTNKYTPNSVDVIIKKVDSAGDNTLKGAMFQLYYIESGNKYWYTNDGKWGKENEAASLISDEDGLLTFEGLDPTKTYYLVEVSAPDGYQRLSHEIKLYWSSGGLQAISNTEASPKEYTVENSTVIVPNQSGAILPETGGSGTMWFTFGGVALIAAAACGYGFKRSRERRDARS